MKQDIFNKIIEHFKKPDSEIKDIENGKYILNRNNDTFGLEYFIINIDKGIFIKERAVEKNAQLKKFNKKDFLMVIGENTGTFTKKTETWKAFIPDKGITVLTERGRRKYLSPMYYSNFESKFGRDLLIEITKYNSPTQQWWLESMVKGEIHGYHNLNRYLDLKILRSCSNMQQWINKINLNTHKFSQNDFKDLNIFGIQQCMIFAAFVNNPHKVVEYLQNDNFNYVQLLDTIKMAALVNTKFNLSNKPDKIKEEHDKVLMPYLDICPVETIQVDKVFVEFASEYNLNLIKDGRELKKEGIIMAHCVNTRANQVKNGYSAIIHLGETGKEGYTVQINKTLQQVNNINFYKLNIYEAKGYLNTKVPQEIIKDLEDKIDEFNHNLKTNALGEIVLETLYDK